jgi:hypothetical protein
VAAQGDRKYPGTEGARGDSGNSLPVAEGQEVFKQKIQQIPTDLFRNELFNQNALNLNS